MTEIQLEIISMKLLMTAMKLSDRQGSQETVHVARNTVRKEMEMFTSESLNTSVLPTVPLLP